MIEPDLSCLGQIVKRNITLMFSLICKELIDPSCTDYSPADIYYEICKLNEFHEDLRHVVIKRYDLPLCKIARLNVYRSRIDQKADADVDDDESYGIEKCRY